jgi:hypothetical protein
MPRACPPVIRIEESGIIELERLRAAFSGTLSTSDG